MASLENVAREIHTAIYRLCVVWGFAISSWFILSFTAPLILADILGSEEAANWQGRLTATTALSGMVFCAMAGYLSDHFGRINVLRPCFLGFFISCVLMLLGDLLRNPYYLWIARAAAMSIPSTVLFAHLSDFISGPALLEAFGCVGATFGVSSLLTAFVCGVLGKFYGRVCVMIFACFLSLMAFILSMVLDLRITAKNHTVGRNSTAPSAPQSASRPSRGMRNPTSPTSERENLVAVNGEAVEVTDIEDLESEPLTPKPALTAGTFLKAFIVVLKNPVLRNLTIAYAILRLASVHVNLMLVIFFKYRLQWGIVDVAIILGISSFLGVLWQIIGMRYVVKYDKAFWVFVGVLTLLPLMMVGYAASMTSAQMYAVSLIGSISSLAYPIFTALITTLSSEGNMAGIALGVGSSMQNAVEIFTAIGFGKFLSWSIAVYEPKEFGLGIPFLFNGAIYSLSLLIVLYTEFKYPRMRELWKSLSSPRT